MHTCNLTTIACSRWGLVTNQVARWPSWATELLVLCLISNSNSFVQHNWLRFVFLCGLWFHGWSHEDCNIDYASIWPPCILHIIFACVEKKNEKGYIPESTQTAEFSPKKLFIGTLFAFEGCFLKIMLDNSSWLCRQPSGWHSQQNITPLLGILNGVAQVKVDRLWCHKQQSLVKVRANVSFGDPV